jgi:hypothetical protein
VHFDVSCEYTKDVSSRYYCTFSGEWSLGNAGPCNWNDLEYVEFFRLCSRQRSLTEKTEESVAACAQIKVNINQMKTTYLISKYSGV